MDFGAASHPGYVRTGNEDAFFASRADAIFAVADGMGGHAHGELASKLALQVIESHAGTIAQATPTELPVLLHEAIQDANIAILSQAEAQDARSRMGTTIVLATIYGDRLYFAHIGDSRLYLLRGDVFSQLTRDHSLVQLMVDRGEISPEEAAIHPLRHQITRVVGGEDFASPEIASQALEPGDVVLLCTDGLSGAVPADVVKELLASAHSAQEKADALVQAALEVGGPDNITAVVFTFQYPRATPPAEAQAVPTHHHLPFWQSLVITVLSLALFLAGIGLWALNHPRYFVAADSTGILHLYKRWPLLPLPVERVRFDASGDYNPDAVPLSLDLVRPNLDGTKYPDVRQGIPVEGRDAGIAFLQDLSERTANRLLQEAKHAAEHADLSSAHRDLERARSLGADANLLHDVEMIIRRAERTPVVLPTPRR